MAKQTFTERFNQIIKGLSNLEVQKILDLGATPTRNLKVGETQTLKLDAGLRLCKARKVSPYWLAGEREPAHDMDVELDGAKVTIYAPSADGNAEGAERIRAFVAEAIRAALAEHDGIGLVRVYNSPTRPIYAGEGELRSSELSAEMNDDLALLAMEVQRLRSDVERLSAFLPNQNDSDTSTRGKKRAG